jgi:signal transduction histidine kinase
MNNEIVPKTQNIYDSYNIIAREIMNLANRGLSRIDFFNRVTDELLRFSNTDAIEMFIGFRNIIYRYENVCRPKKRYEINIIRHSNGEIPDRAKVSANTDLEKLSWDIFFHKTENILPHFTKNGSFWTNDSTAPVDISLKGVERTTRANLTSEYLSLALIPHSIDEHNSGLLILKSLKRDAFGDDMPEFYEGLSQTLGLAIAYRRIQNALKERVKELTCLYGISQIAQKPDTTIETIMKSIVEQIPQAWQFPEIAYARITLDDTEYSSLYFAPGTYAQSRDIVVKGEKRGTIEVVYSEKKPEFEFGVFLPEEENLIETIARQIALIIERKYSEEEKSRLEVQLRHADRLATIGQLAAGVAHELNEPLAGILGFSQLVKKSPDMTPAIGADIDRIIAASMHAREVVRKLLLFGRQLPPQKVEVDLNGIIETGLFFIDSRCAKEGIELVRHLDPNLPKIVADQSQMHQVLVNLIVNAIQAMPCGGKLTVATKAHHEYISLTIEDTGTGMSAETLEKIFMPFYTTKDVGEGTGLGLPVVHGIVTAHKGTISVQSAPGKGSRFEIRFPLHYLRKIEKES